MNRWIKRFAVAPIFVTTATGPVVAQETSHWMTPNGYSGLGIVPSATVLREGTASINYSRGLPVHPRPLGYNYQAGFGMGYGLEGNFRLATQSLNCNYFNGECPSGTIRDLAGSFKWSPTLHRLNREGLHVALGASDVGGAATNFRSYYGVATGLRSWGEWTVGYAKAQSAAAPIDGLFGAVTWKPYSWALLSLQHAKGAQSVHAGFKWAVPHSRVELVATGSAPIGSPVGYPKSWASVGVNVPLANLSRELVTARNGGGGGTTGGTPYRSIQPMSVELLGEALRVQGLHQHHIAVEADGAIQVVIENTAFPNHVLDALGVAMGVVAGLDASTSKSDTREVAASRRAVSLVITQRGLPLVQAYATPQCYRQQLTADSGECLDLHLVSLTHEKPIGVESISAPWLSTAVRPDITLAPVLNSTIGTEVGAFDAELAWSAHMVMPLWRGASLDVQRLATPGWRTGEFKDGGALEGFRLKPGITRRMVHQVWQFSSINTQVRASVGTGFGEWRGRHLETSTTTPGGDHRAGFIVGRFTGPPQRDPFFGLIFADAPRPVRSYQLFQYRWTYGQRRDIQTEITAGTFWGQDTGASLVQRFWFGDTAVSAYYRRSEMKDVGRPIAFAGLQLTVPLTPRKSLTSAFGTLRGTSAWSYAIESKVGETDNLLTSGYGEIPRFGESLAFLSNRDRNDGPSLRNQMWRARDAFHRLTRD